MSSAESTGIRSGHSKGMVRKEFAFGVGMNTKTRPRTMLYPGPGLDLITLITTRWTAARNAIQTRGICSHLNGGKKLKTEGLCGCQQTLRRIRTG